jgi:hypothetical protein
LDAILGDVLTARNAANGLRAFAATKSILVSRITETAEKQDAERGIGWQCGGRRPASVKKSLAVVEQQREPSD